MIFVDSSVWIDFFAGRTTDAVTMLAKALDRDEVVIGDLVLIEVLQGIANEREFQQTLALLNFAPIISVSSREVPVAAARNYRHLRTLGITIRKTIDSLIATRCILDGHALLHSDRDFQPFVDHLGLIDAMTL